MGHRKRGEGTAGVQRQPPLAKWAVKHDTRTLMHLVLLWPWRVATGQLWAVSQSGMVTNWEERPHGSLSSEWKIGQRKEVFS